MATLFIGLLMILIGLVSIRFKLYKLDFFYLLTRSHKEQVDIEDSKAKAIEKSLVVCGLLMIIASLLMQYFNMQYIEVIVFWIIMLITLVLSVYFDISRSGIFRKKKIVILSITAILTVALLYSSYTSPRLLLSDTELTCDSIYGFDINLNDIDSIGITDKLPVIIYRSNGSSFMGVLKGYFQTKRYGEIKLQLDKNSKRYIFIKEKSGDILFVNTGNVDRTQKLFEAIWHKRR